MDEGRQVKQLSGGGRDLAYRVARRVAEPQGGVIWYTVCKSVTYY